MSADRIVALIAAFLATAGSVALMAHDAWTGHVTLEHGLSVAAVALTIAGAVMAHRRAHVGSWGWAAAFAVMCATGSAMTAYTAISRQTEGAEVRRASTELTNSLITEKQRDLEITRTRHREAQAVVDRFTAPAKPGGEPRACDSRACKDWQRRAREVAALVQRSTREITQLGAVHPVNAPADKVAAIADAMGFDGKRAGTLVTLLQPLLWPVLFEFSAILCFAFAFSHTSTIAPTFTLPTITVDNCAEDCLGGSKTCEACAIGRGSIAPVPSRVSGPQLMLEDCASLSPAEISLAKLRGNDFTNEQLAEVLGISPSHTSRRVTQTVIEGRAVRVRDGRFVKITL